LSGGTASVTGASGMIGRRICQRLIARGYRVRALSRQATFTPDGIEVIRGSLLDPDALRRLLGGAEVVFHCAAELNDESKMWAVNVSATRQLLELAAASGITRFCHMSSVGVVGQVRDAWVDETAACDPQNAYEKSKLAAEQAAARGIPGCSTVILRPTDVVDADRPGVLWAPRRRSLKDFAKLALTGGECAHLVHAEDVADAAVYVTLRAAAAVETFNVSCDHEPFNTLSELWPLYRAYRAGREADSIHGLPHLPIAIPYLMRRALRGSGNRGDVRYQGTRLLNTGFTFHLGVKGAVRQIAHADAEASA
jgi:nucleoside-diphosphate-sugar epimerase